MRAVYNSYNTPNVATNSYQQDKDQLNAFMDKMKKAIDKGDFDTAQSLLEEAAKLVESNTTRKRSTKISQQQAEFKSQLETLSGSLENKNKGSALETIATIKDELKNNKNLVLKSHNSSDMIAELRSQYLLSLYA
ncbi:MAG: hypothetical protein WA099_02220 [Sulfuricurvum sp.]